MANNNDIPVGALIGELIKKVTPSFIGGLSGGGGGGGNDENNPPGGGSPLEFSFTDGSTCTNTVTYNPITRDLTVEFKQRGTYKYGDVPMDVYLDFKNNGSHGTFFNQSVRNNYVYERIG